MLNFKFVFVLNNLINNALAKFIYCVYVLIFKCLNYRNMFDKYV